MSKDHFKQVNFKVVIESSTQRQLCNSLKYIKVTLHLAHVI